MPGATSTQFTGPNGPEPVQNELGPHKEGNARRNYMEAKRDRVHQFTK
jgi:hypothetical protein